MFYNPAPLGFWSFATICGVLKGPRVDPSAVAEMLEAWELTGRALAGTTALHANGQLLLPDGAESARLHFRAQIGVTLDPEGPSDRELQVAGKLQADFAAFASDRLKWSAAIHPMEGSFRISGTPRTEPGELVPRSALQVDGILPPEASLVVFPSVKFYRVGDGWCLGDIVPLTTWAIAINAAATEEQLCAYGSRLAQRANWRALVIDRKASERYWVEQGCYWQERATA